MKAVFITGGAKRLGKAMLLELHSQGYQIIFQYLSSRKEALDLCQQLNKLRNNSAHCIQADLSKSEDIEKVVNFVAKFSNLSLLINNASQFYQKSVQESTETDWQKIIDSNLKAPFFLSKGLYDLLNISYGNIINIVDIYGERPLKMHSIYSMSKAGLIMQTKSLAVELGPNIRVNGIAPGAILWPENGVQSNAQKILNKTTLKRQGSEQDIVQAMLYLNSANYVSGQIIQIDGGRSLYI